MSRFLNGGYTLYTYIIHSHTHRYPLGFSSVLRACDEHHVIFLDVAKLCCQIMQCVCEREREKKTDTHTHTHTERERERDNESLGDKERERVHIHT